MVSNFNVNRNTNMGHIKGTKNLHDFFLYFLFKIKSPTAQAGLELTYAPFFKKDLFIYGI